MAPYILLLFLNFAICVNFTHRELVIEKTTSEASKLISEFSEAVTTAQNEETIKLALGIIKSPNFPSFYSFNTVYKWVVGDIDSRVEYTLYSELLSLTEHSFFEFYSGSTLVENVTSELLKESEVLKVQTEGISMVIFTCPDVNEETLPFWFYFRDVTKVPAELVPVLSDITGNISSSEVGKYSQKYLQYIWIINAPENSRIDGKIKISQKSPADSLTIGSGLIPRLGSKNMIIGGNSATEQEFTIENEHAYIMMNQFDLIQFKFNYTINVNSSAPKPTPPSTTLRPINSNVETNDMDSIEFLIRGFNFTQVAGWKIEILTVAKLKHQFSQMGRKYCEDQNITLDKELTDQDIILTFMACKETCHEPMGCLKANLSIHGTVNDSKIFSTDVLMIIVSDYWSFGDLSCDFNINCSFQQWALWSSIIILIAVLSPTLIICKWKMKCSPYNSMKESKVSIEEKVDQGERYENMGCDYSCKASTIMWNEASDNFHPNEETGKNRAFESSEDSESEDEIFQKR